jgi:hypothetical protein
MQRELRTGWMSIQPNNELVELLAVVSFHVFDPLVDLGNPANVYGVPACLPEHVGVHQPLNDDGVDALPKMAGRRIQWSPAEFRRT